MTSKLIVDNLFGERLRTRMKTLEASQVAVAKLVNVTQPEVHYWINGKAVPKRYNLQALAYCLRVNYEWLCSGTGEELPMEPYPLEVFWTDLGERINFLIWVNRMNLVKLAIEIQVSYTLLQYWIDGERKTKDEQLSNLANFFSCPTQWLKSGGNEESMKRYIPEVKKVNASINEHYTQLEEFWKKKHAGI